MKKIILCADDYGQNESISQAIITLIEKNRLSATSCMTTSPFWPSHASWLQPIKKQADIGLHFNLTEGQALSSEYQFSSLKKLLGKAHWRMLNVALIEAELNAQLDCFEAHLGQPPDFIDGHQHVHQLPVIRQALLNVYEKRLRKHGSYIRSVYDPKIFLRWGSRNSVKNLIIQLLTGALRFKKLLVKRKIPHNLSFAGIYQFTDALHYSKIFPRFLDQSKEGGIIMCHPALNNSTDSDSDVIATARYHEFQYLDSEQFLKDCRAAEVILGRLR